MAGYSGTPLVAKLGIKPGHRLVLRDAPADFLATLGPLPAQVSVTPAPDDDARADLVLVFATEAAALARAFGELKPVLESNGALWAAWPKKAAKVPTDLVEDAVRRIGLDAGLVDVKVCAIDEVWSGLKFVYRVADRDGRR